jgi:pilus assembly protein Flp/PilA
MVNEVARLWRNEEGATMVEYALMLAFIAIVCALAVSALGVKTGTVYSTASQGLP